MSGIDTMLRVAGPSGGPPLFGAVLRRYRARLGISQQELAARSTVSVRAIRDLEAGRASRPRRDTVGLLAGALALRSADRLELERAVGRTGAPVSLAPPVALNEVVGREPEVAVLRELLAPGRQRLVTLTGLAGVGKSTLAVRAADEIQRAYGLPVLWDRAPEDLPRVVADQRALLVWDGYTPAQAAPGTLVALLRDCPRLHVLVTAPAPVGAPDERTVPVHPLPVPDPAHLAETPATRLLTSHAARVRPDLTIAPHTVAALCRALDGIPAALESAACWFPVTPPEAVLAQLRDDPRALLADDVPGLFTALTAALATLDATESTVLHGLSGPRTVAEAAARTNTPLLRCARAIRHLLVLGLVRPAHDQAHDHFQALELLQRELERGSRRR
jgi:transcriptional regulator with XRE-family HTH domain